MQPPAKDKRRQAAQIFIALFHSLFNLDSNRLSILLLFRRFFFLFSAIVFLFFLFCVWPKRKIKQRRL